MRAPIALCAILVAGCATTNYSDQMNSGLAALRGQDLHVAIAKLGEPAGKPLATHSGGTLYEWDVPNKNRPHSVSTTLTQTGNAGQYTAGNFDAFVHMDYVCTVLMTVGPDGVIKDYQWEGAKRGSGCKPFAAALAPH